MAGRVMGRDSIDMQRSQFVMYAILFLMGEACACDLYQGEYQCMRCDLLARGEQAYPIQHRQALTTMARKHGFQP